MEISDLIIETERLTLRVLDWEFAPKVLSYFNRNRGFLQIWEAVKPEEFYTVEYHEGELKRELIKMLNDQLFKAWIFKRDDIYYENPIGSIALNNIVRGCFQSCHLGYRLDAKEINKGYMTEALREVVMVGFTELQLHRIEANIMPRNIASMRVVEKLGFYDEGLAKRYLKINGKWEDHIHMVLLNESME